MPFDRKGNPLFPYICWAMAQPLELYDEKGTLFERVLNGGALSEAEAIRGQTAMQQLGYEVVLMRPEPSPDQAHPCCLEIKVTQDVLLPAELGRLRRHTASEILGSRELLSWDDICKQIIELTGESRDDLDRRLALAFGLADDPKLLGMSPAAMVFSDVDNKLEEILRELVGPKP